jgi:hypothetical protein
MRTRTCNDEERTRILGSHALARWADATLETFDGGKHRKLTVSDDGDDTIVAAFQRKNRKSSWEQVELDSVSKMKVVATTPYLLMFCAGPMNKRPKITDGSTPREKAATPQQPKSQWDWNMWLGTIWLTYPADVNTGKVNAGKPLFQIVDDDDTVPDELERDQEDILKPFVVENGAWKMANVLYNTGHDQTLTDKVVLWVCVDEHNNIQDVSISPYGKHSYDTNLT